MSDAFDAPPGDPGALTTAADGLMTVASDVDTQNTATKTAVATAISEWRAPRGDDFRHAGAGLQAELTVATTAIERVAELVGAYAKALAQTQHDVASLSSQAARVQSDASHSSAKMSPNDPDQDRLFQRTAQRQGQLVTQAQTAKSELATLAGKIAAQIDAETDVAVPGSATLSPDQIRRQVDSSLGVSGLQGAAANGTLTDAQAWAALASAQQAVPADAVRPDGEVDWKKAVGEFNDKYVGPPTVLGALGTTPSEGWALARLIQNQRALAQDAVSLRTAFSDIVGPVAYRLDQGLASLTDLNDALIRFRNGEDAYRAFSASSQTEQVVKSAAAGGLPETGAIGALGKLAAGLGVFSDVLTIIDPGLENKTEGNAMRVAAAANIVGTGMAFAGPMAALVGINAVADWIPVVGEVVMVATGLILAGDYVYHHWDQISNFVTNTVPDALGDAASATGDALVSGAKAVGDFFSSVF